MIRQGRLTGACRVGEETKAGCHAPGLNDLAVIFLQQTIAMEECQLLKLDHSTFLEMKEIQVMNCWLFFLNTNN